MERRVVGVRSFMFYFSPDEEGSGAAYGQSVSASVRPSFPRDLSDTQRDKAGPHYKEKI